MKKDIKKLIESRLSREKRKDSPYRFFSKKVVIADDLLLAINKNIKKEKLIQEARKQFIISHVTALEVYLKDIFIITMNKLDINREKFQKLEFKLNIEEIISINKNELSPGDFIASYYNFQNLQNIQKAFSILIDNDFLDEIIKYNKEFFIGPEYWGYLKDDYYQQLEKIIDLRHKFVHDSDFSYKLKMDELESLTYNLFNFVTTVDDYLSKYIDQIEKSSKKK